MGTCVMFAIVKNGAFYSVQHNDWFEELTPSCLTLHLKEAEANASVVYGRVVTFKLERLY